MAREPAHRGGDRRIGRRRSGEAGGERGFERGELGRDPRRLADPLRQRIRARAPEVAERGVAVDQLAGRQAEDHACGARAQAGAEHGRARAERHHDGPGGRPRHHGRRGPDPDHVGAAIRQHAMVMKDRALADRLRPDAEHVARQRRGRRPLAIGRGRQFRSDAARCTRHPIDMAPALAAASCSDARAGDGRGRESGRQRAGDGSAAAPGRAAVRVRARRGPRRCAPQRCPRSPGGRSGIRPPGCSTSPRRAPRSRGSKARRTARRPGPD
jgi:hypothetical protein